MPASTETAADRPWIVSEVLVRYPTPPPPEEEEEEEEEEALEQQPTEAGKKKKKKARRGKRPPRPVKKDRIRAKSLANKIEERHKENRLARIEAEYDRDERYGSFYDCRISYEPDESDSWPDNVEDSSEEEGPASDYGHSSEVEEILWAASTSTVTQGSGFNVATSSAYSVDSDFDDELLAAEAAGQNVATEIDSGIGRGVATIVQEEEEEGPVHRSGENVATSRAPFQPWGDYCLCICRLSSWSAAAKYGGDSSVAATREQARSQVVADRERDGDIMISRLENNSPTPFRFKQKISMCFQRKSSEFTHFNKKSGKKNGMAKDIRNWVQSLPPNARLTLLVRGPDGLSVDSHSLLTFVEMIEEEQKDLQMVFQYNKVYDSIRPTYLIPILGLGSVFVLEKDEVMRHSLQDGDTKEDWFSADVDRFFSILDKSKESKAAAQGIQDRNQIPDVNQLGSKEGTAASQTFVRKNTRRKRT